MSRERPKSGPVNVVDPARRAAGTARKEPRPPSGFWQRVSNWVSSSGTETEPASLVAEENSPNASSQPPQWMCLQLPSGRVLNLKVELGAKRHDDLLSLSVVPDSRSDLVLLEIAAARSGSLSTMDTDGSAELLDLKDSRPEQDWEGPEGQAVDILTGQTLQPPVDEQAHVETSVPVQRGGALTDAAWRQEEERMAKRGTPNTSGTEDAPAPVAKPGAKKGGSVRRAPVVGIDFGTSYSSIGVLSDGLRVIGDADGELLVPSVVAFPAPGKILIGKEARAAMAKQAQWTISSPKRMLGKAYRDPQLDSLLGTLAIRTFAGTDKLVRFEAHGEIYSVTDICALIMTQLRERATAFLGLEVRKAVLNIPIGFGLLQRSALEAAARQAGLQVAAIVSEPSAVLLAHGFSGRRGVVAVYDFGGGTFDFSLIEITDAAFRVICAGGDPWLGGDDFDHALANNMADRFWHEYGVDVRTRAVEWQSLILACEETKRKLSKQGVAELRAPNLLFTAEGQQDLTYTITRNEFEQVAQPLIDRSLEVALRVMDQANIEPQDIDLVITSGGTSLIPAIQRAVAQLFDKNPICLDPELAVVRGAALRGAELGGEATVETPLGGRTLREVCGRTIAVSTEDGRIVVLFERSTPLPAEVHHTFVTCRNAQTEMALSLFEGTQVTIDDRQVLGVLRYKGIAPAPAGKGSVAFNFLLDDDGMLHITAKVEDRVYEKTISI